MESQETDDYQQILKNPDTFTHKLTTFHSSLGNSSFIHPSIGRTPLDLHRLFVEVASRGGLHQVIRDRKWEEVVSAFKFPETRISMSFVLRKYYLSLLYQFEQAYLFKKSVAIVPVSGAVKQVSDVVSTSASAIEAGKESAPVSHLSANPQVHVGVSLVGVIDEKFDNGYVVSINVGSAQLKGILYHIPEQPQPCWSPDPGISQHRKRKKSRLTMLDPSEPNASRKSYNFDPDPEDYATVLPVAQGQMH